MIKCDNVIFIQQYILQGDLLCFFGSDCGDRPRCGWGLVSHLITGASPGVRQYKKYGDKSPPYPHLVPHCGRWGHTVIGALYHVLYSVTNLSSWLTRRRH